MAHSHNWQIAAGSWQEAAIPLHLGAYTWLLVCLHDRVAGLPQSQQSKMSRQKQQWHLWPHLGSQTHSVLQCSSTNQPVLPYSVWDLFRGTTARRLGSLGAILKASCQSSSLPYFILTMCSFHSPSKKKAQIESLLFISPASSLVQDTVHTRLHCNILPSDLPLSALVTLMHFSHSSLSFIFSMNEFNIFIVILLQARFALKIYIVLKI